MFPFSICFFHARVQTQGRSAGRATGRGRDGQKAEACRGAGETGEVQPSLCHAGVLARPQLVEIVAVLVESLKSFHPFAVEKVSGRDAWLLVSDDTRSTLAPTAPSPAGLRRRTLRSMYLLGGVPTVYESANNRR